MGCGARGVKWTTERRGIVLLGPGAGKIREKLATGGQTASKSRQHDDNSVKKYVWVRI